LQQCDGAFALRHPYLEASIERAQGCFDLVDSGCVMQVEQPIDLHQVPIQASSELGFLHAAVAHGLKDFQLEHRERSFALPPITVQR
jgi:hypothetical protein